MLEKLDSIPWSELSDCYGNASGVPRLIRMLASPKRKDRSEALEYLFGCIVHQGSVCEATEAAVPFFIELLEDSSVKTKEDILELLAFMIEGPDGFLDASESSQALPLHRQVFSEICKGTKCYLGLLADGSARVRAGSIHLLGYCAARNARLHALIRRHFQTEVSNEVRATCVFSVGLLKKANRANAKWFRHLIESIDARAANAPGRPTGARPIPASRWSAGVIGNTNINKDRTLRIWAAIGLFRCADGSVPDSAYAAVYDGLVSSSSYAKGRNRVPVVHLDMVSVCCHALSLRKTDLRSRENLLRALNHITDGWDALPLIVAVLDVVFQGKRINERMARKNIDAMQAIASCDAFWSTYETRVYHSRIEHSFRNCSPKRTQAEFKAFLAGLEGKSR